MPRPLSLSVLALAVLTGSAVAQTTEAPVNPNTATSSPFIASAPDDVMGSNLIDLEVKDAQGARVGEIEDVVLDPSHAARGVVIGIGGYRGGNVRHVGIAMTALKVSKTAEGKWQAVLTVPAETLKSAPAFTYQSGFNDD